MNRVNDKNNQITLTELHINKYLRKNICTG